MNRLEDTDLMPFGKFKGKPMQDVPADYLHYLWSSGMKQKTKTDAVAAYIERNIAALTQEHPDAIWS